MTHTSTHSSIAVTIVILVVDLGAQSSVERRTIEVLLDTPSSPRLWGKRGNPGVGIGNQEGELRAFRLLGWSSFWQVGVEPLTFRRDAWCAQVKT